jgi:hypothetical protein
LVVRRALRALSTWASRSPQAEFRSAWYSRHNRRRQEHLASLGLSLDHCSVLEVGAGIGDHTSFFFDRSCAITTSDARQENLVLLRESCPYAETLLLDLDDPPASRGRRFEVVYCYGTLYHLSRPAEALAFLAGTCSRLLLLETWVSPDDGVALNPIVEDRANVTQSASGHGCRPTRAWVLAELRKQLPYAYITRTQPWHPEFPLDWRAACESDLPTRAVFVGSRTPLGLPTLLEETPQIQTRH